MLRLATFLSLSIVIFSVNTFADCGITGSVEERIANCNIQKKTKGGFMWRLVSEHARPYGFPSYEVWRDERSKLLWGPELGTHDFYFTQNLCLNKASSSFTIEQQSIQSSLITDKKWNLPTVDQFKRAYAHGFAQIFSKPYDGEYLDAYWAMHIVTPEDWHGYYPRTGTDEEAQLDRVVSWMAEGDPRTFELRDGTVGPEGWAGAYDSHHARCILQSP